MTSVRVPIAVTESSAGATVTFTGDVKAARPKFTPRCRVGKDGKVSLRIKAKKGKTLTKVLGPTLNIGFAAAPTVPAGTSLTVKFGNPS